MSFARHLPCCQTTRPVDWKNLEHPPFLQWFAVGTIFEAKKLRERYNQKRFYTRCIFSDFVLSLRSADRYVLEKLGNGMTSMNNRERLYTGSILSRVLGIRLFRLHLYKRVCTGCPPVSPLHLLDMRHQVPKMGLSCCFVC